MNRAPSWPAMRQVLIGARAMRGMTQHDVATVCGVAPQSITRWETGSVTPGADKLWSWANAVGVELHYNNPPGQL